MATTKDLALSRIGQIAVPVHDLERAVRFYGEVLGMRMLFDTPKMAFFDCDGVRLMLSVPETEDVDHPASIIYYRVDDITGAFEELGNRGVRFEGEPHMIAELGDHELWMAFFRDADENLLALMSEVPTAG